MDHTAVASSTPGINARSSVPLRRDHIHATADKSKAYERDPARPAPRMPQWGMRRTRSNAPVTAPTTSPTVGGEKRRRA